MKENIVMFNSKNNVKIVTNPQFQSHWERLGFVVVTNIILLNMAG